MQIQKNSSSFIGKSTGLILLLQFLFFSLTVPAQNKYWISFKDKNGTSFDPYSYFDARTILQRQKHHLPLSDSSDFPVNETYLAQVSKIADSLSWSSRWLNGVAAFASADELDQIARLPCVGIIEPMSRATDILSAEASDAPMLSRPEMELLKFQTGRMQANLFREKGLDGSGIRIAVFDVGFPGVDTHPAFERLRGQKRIIATYDFVSKKNFVFAHHWHGTATLSCIVGEAGPVQIGMATGAEILLARTERAHWENFSEEENWLAAAEWADRLGVNIISSSLGFTREKYFNTDMNGRKSLVARAATMAASKGILVVNAAGNEGTNYWRIIDTPGDADSVLTVGGTDPEHDVHIGFSSFGPTADGRLKPNVSALGKAIVARGSGYAVAYGTSFATPLVAGFAACAWQSHRELGNMDLFSEIEKSAHLYPYFDYAHGYGIPQAKYFIHSDSLPEPTFNFVIINDDIKVSLSEKYSHTLEERALGYSTERNLYYKVSDKNGSIRKYYVISGPEKDALDFKAGDFQNGDEITVHFEGYTSSFTINNSIDNNPVK